MPDWFAFGQRTSPTSRLERPPVWCRHPPVGRCVGPQLLLAVVMLHAVGFGVGYLFARMFGYDRTISRTISIEVGMQNSGLGVVLAQRHFPTEPLTAVPCAISSVTHSVIGSLLAGWWRLSPRDLPIP